MNVNMWKWKSFFVSISFSRGWQGDCCMQICWQLWRAFFSPILSAICKWNCFAIYLSFNSGNKKKLLNKSTYRIYQSSSWDMLMCSCRCCDWGCCRPEVLKFFPSLYLFAVILPRSIEKFFLRSVLLSLISGCHCEDIIMSLQKKIVFPNPIYFYFF